MTRASYNQLIPAAFMPSLADFFFPWEGDSAGSVSTAQTHGGEIDPLRRMTLTPQDYTVPYDGKYYPVNFPVGQTWSINFFRLNFIR